MSLNAASIRCKSVLKERLLFFNDVQLKTKQGTKGNQDYNVDSTDSKKSLMRAGHFEPQGPESGKAITPWSLTA